MGGLCHLFEGDVAPERKIAEGGAQLLLIISTLMSPGVLAYHQMSSSTFQRRWRSGTRNFNHGHQTVHGDWWPQG